MAILRNSFVLFALCATVLANNNNSRQIIVNNGNNNQNGQTTKTEQKQSTDVSIPAGGPGALLGGKGKRDLHARALRALFQRDPEYELTMELLTRAPPKAPAAKGAKGGKSANPGGKSTGGKGGAKGDAPSKQDIQTMVSRIKKGEVSAIVVEAAIKHGHIKAVGGYTPTGSKTDAVSKKVADWLNKGGDLVPEIENALISTKHYLDVKADQTPDDPKKGGKKGGKGGAGGKGGKGGAEGGVKGGKGAGGKLKQRDFVNDILSTRDMEHLYARGLVDIETLEAREADEAFDFGLEARDAADEFEEYLFARDPEAFAEAEAEESFDFYDLYY